MLQRVTGAGISHSPASWRARELPSPKPPADNQRRGGTETPEDAQSCGCDSPEGQGAHLRPSRGPTASPGLHETLRGPRMESTASKERALLAALIGAVAVLQGGTHTAHSSTTSTAPAPRAPHQHHTGAGPTAPRRRQPAPAAAGLCRRKQRAGSGDHTCDPPGWVTTSVNHLAGKRARSDITEACKLWVGVGETPAEQLPSQQPFIGIKVLGFSLPPLSKPPISPLFTVATSSPQSPRLQT